MIVTDLVSRGIDLDFVNFIINMDFPQKTKDFIHRCGRTGRAGRHGTCLTLMQPNEKPYLVETMTYIGS
jgi:superfamily II DNA/RNA helicase